MPLKLAIVGRPNVGKSTLFNRLAGRALAIVDDQPGVTRDRRFGTGRLGDLDLELDETFAEILRRRGKPVVLVANKSEGKAGDAGALEAYALGLGEPVPLSAAHGEGMSDLYDALVAAAPAARDHE